MYNDNLIWIQVWNETLHPVSSLDCSVQKIVWQSFFYLFIPIIVQSYQHQKHIIENLIKFILNIRLSNWDAKNNLYNHLDWWSSNSHHNGIETRKNITWYWSVKKDSCMTHIEYPYPSNLNTCIVKVYKRRFIVLLK